MTIGSSSASSGKPTSAEPTGSPTHINFILYQAPAGEYELTITVEDRISGAVSGRRRSFTVTEDGPTATM